MPIYEVKGPDGKTYDVNVPDGATAEQAMRYVKQTYYGNTEQAKPIAQPAEQQSGFARGLLDPIEGGAQLLESITPEVARNAINRLNNYLAQFGVVAPVPEGGVAQSVRERELAYQQQRGDQGIDWGRMAGNILSPANVALAARIPVVASTAGRVAVGAGAGAGMAALNPTAEQDIAAAKANQAITGAIGGASVPAVAGALSRVIRPQASAPGTQAKMLMAEGVEPTAGQIAGGRVAAAEEKATSIPILGDAISNARQRTIEQFNLAAINRATSPIGVRVEQTGFEGVKEAGDALSKAYDDVLGNIKAVNFDKQFMGDLQNLKTLTAGLPKDMQDAFNRELNRRFGNRMSPAKGMTAQTFKEADSEVGRLARSWLSSDDGLKRQVGTAYLELQSLMRDQVARQHPQYAPRIADINRGWANLVRVENAAKAAKNAEGVFTPAQLNTAIQGAESSVRKRSVARGEGLMQDLARAGQAVIGSKVPNSFTADRAGLAALGLGSGFYSPLIPAGLLAGAGLYSQPAQNVIRAAMTQRPGFAAPVAQLVEQASPFAIPIAGTGAAGLLNQ